jgi:hypothetical protein
MLDSGKGRCRQPLLLQIPPPLAGSCRQPQLLKIAPPPALSCRQPQLPHIPPPPAWPETSADGKNVSTAFRRVPICRESSDICRKETEMEEVGIHANNTSPSAANVPSGGPSSGISYSAGAPFSKKFSAGMSSTDALLTGNKSPASLGPKAWLRRTSSDGSFSGIKKPGAGPPERTPEAKNPEMDSGKTSGIRSYVARSFQPLFSPFLDCIVMSAKKVNVMETCVPAST